MPSLNEDNNSVPKVESEAWFAVKAVARMLTPLAVLSTAIASLAWDFNKNDAKVTKSIAGGAVQLVQKAVDGVAYLEQEYLIEKRDVKKPEGAINTVKDAVPAADLEVQPDMTR